MYADVLKNLEKKRPSAVVTLLNADLPASLPIGGKKYYSQTQVTGSFGDYRLDQAADDLAAQALEQGRLITEKISCSDGQAEQVLLAAEPFFPPENLVIFGGGNIAYALVQITALLGYHITVVDDRPSFANKQRFPAPVEVICDNFSHAIENMPLGRWSKAVIVTRGHQHDLECLQAVIQKDVGYLGMIGSRRRVALIKKHLKEQGVEQARLDRVYMPIGLDLGAQTPEEIAVSIAAELIKVKYGKDIPSVSGVNYSPKANCGISQQDLNLLHDVELFQQQGIPAALATVITSRGSTPRKAGAKMLVRRDGGIVGTIGGGCIEGEVKREALTVMDTGKPGLYKFFLDNDVAANEGMACGGTLEVFIEPLNRQ